MQPASMLNVAIGWLALIVAGSASAAEPTMAFECDTPGGHYSYWSRTVSGSEIDVSGKLVVNEVRPDKDWMPAVNVTLSGGADGRTPVGLHLYALKKLKDLYFVELRKVGGHDAIGLGTIPSTKEPMPFRVLLDASGKLTVTLSGVDASTQLTGFNPQKLELSCSTGDFEFTEIRVLEK